MTDASIQFVDLKRQYLQHKSEIDLAIQSAISRGDFILGEDTREFETEFVSFLDPSKKLECIGVADGTDALHLALLALDVGAGDEVIVPANTFIASVLAISNCGATPVLVDCEPHYYTMDIKAVEAAITPRTKAILAVHLYGHPADMDPILEIAKERGISVVEDAAQAHGAMYKRRACGTIGDVGCFSFYPGKNLGAYGDGGAAVTANPSLADRLRLLRNYGQRRKYVHEVRGFNSRLDTVQAAILRVKLRHLPDWNARRRAVAETYSQRLMDCGVKLPSTASWAMPVWHLYVVETSERDCLQQSLSDRKISTGIHYPVPIHLQAAYSDLGYGVGSFPVTELVANRILSLPMFPEIMDCEVERVVTAVKESLA